jgi:polar amino acid transport system ATP-binding protein
MMVVTHEMGFAREVGDVVSVMDHGVVLESGPPAQIFDAPLHARTREFLQAVVTRAGPKPQATQPATAPLAIDDH